MEFTTTITVADTTYTVTYTTNTAKIHQAFLKEMPRMFTYDVESNGVHIKKHRPFLAAVCFNQQVFVTTPTPKFYEMMVKWGNRVRRVYGHNVTFDMHMMANAVGDDKAPLQIPCWGDTMGLVRLVVDALSKQYGGESLALKSLGAKYIDSGANEYEKEVKAWLKAKKAANRRVLIGMLHGIVDEGGKWTIKRFEDAFNKGTETLPEPVLEVHRQWKIHCPEPTYQDVPLEIIVPYAAVDVILTQRLVYKSLPVIVYREQTRIAEIDSDILPVVYKMERKGLPVDREYLQDSAVKLGRYIEELYIRLHALSGMEFTVGQHAVIKKLYADLLGEEPASTKKQFLKKLEATRDDTAGEIAGIITRLRRLEKWKSVYVERILEVSEYDGRFYTSINPYIPVTGRFSSDAQQFPRNSILTEEGYVYEKETGHKAPPEMVLYDPRRAFIGKRYYIDYSQVELRIQAHYTMFFGGDVNLLRAYMPYACVHHQTGEPFQYETFEQRKRWIEVRPDAPKDLHWEDLLKAGWSVWINPDTGDYWIPTDVHSATTLKALNIIGLNHEEMSEKEFKWWRDIGKRFNFMRNYGGGDAKASEVLDIPLEHAKAMNRGYTDAFPVVVTYQNAVIATMREKGYCENLYGRRYYLSVWHKHYTVGNHLIQGSGAYLLKTKMIEIDRFLEENNCQTGMVLCVHDELQFDDVPGEEWVIDKIRQIMEDTPEINVPIVAEIEHTETNWSEKRKWQYKAT